MATVRHGLPKILRIRILQPCNVGGGKTAIEGDVWDLATAGALALITAEQAERIVLDDGVIELRERVEVYAESPDDPAPKLISRIPERERKPRPKTLVPLNGHNGTWLWPQFTLARTL